MWESAIILRGPVDAADFKTYIFPLLFFKRTSDVFDEEISEAVDESGGEREVQIALRKTLLKYPLHKDQDLSDRVYGYIRQYY